MAIKNIYGHHTNVLQNICIDVDVYSKATTFDVSDASIYHMCGESLNYDLNRNRQRLTDKV